MITENIVFNHNTGNVPLAFGLTEDRANEITASIFFIEIDKTYTAHQLYDDMREAPKEFTTKTAVLDTLLDDCNTNAEALYAAFEWGKHLTLSACRREYKEMTAMMTMLYMTSGQDKTKFIKEFAKRVTSKNTEDEEED